MSKRAKTLVWSLCLGLAAGTGTSLRAQGQAAAGASSSSAPLALGTPAPSAVLLFGGKSMALKNLLARNRTAILFYPAACESCATELQAIDKPTLQQLGKLGFSVFAVSPDAPSEQAATVSKLALTYPVVSDPNGAAARAFHVTGSALFLIDRDGSVRYVSNLDQSPLQGSGLVAAAQSLRHSSRIPH